MVRPDRLAAWWMMALLATPAAIGQRTPRALTVRIDTPRAGIVEWDESRTLRAMVSDPAVTSAQIDLNGTVYEVPVEHGRIEQTIAPAPGNNRVVISVRRGTARTRASATFYERVSGFDRRQGVSSTGLVAIVGWSSDGADLIRDLELRLQGECADDSDPCELSMTPVRFGGETGPGFGMGTFFARDLPAGRYRLEVEPPDGGFGFHEEPALTNSIAAWDEIERALASSPPRRRAALLRQRRAALDALDALAASVAHRSTVHVTVLFAANTPSERRWQFDVPFSFRRAAVPIGEIVITEAMIRAARDDGAEP